MMKINYYFLTSPLDIGTKKPIRATIVRTTHGNIML